MAKDCTKKEVTRAPSTETAYAARALALHQQAGRERKCKATTHTLVNWFGDQDERWQPSTIRQYCAAIRFAIDTIAEKGEITLNHAAHLRECVGAGPMPMGKRASPKRTSRRKRKSISWDEFVALEAELRDGSEWNQLAADFLAFNIRLALRPCEYATARIDGTDVTVTNAKATNGRANGKTRPVSVAHITEEDATFLPALQTFLARIRDKASAAGGFRKLTARLATRIARACVRINIRRVSMYTTRHIATATAKQSMPPEEVAALVGHRTTATAAKHYARRRSGFAHKLTVAKPSPAAVMSVVSSPKQSRTTNIAYQTARKAAGKPSPPGETPERLGQSSGKRPDARMGDRPTTGDRSETGDLAQHRRLRCGGFANVRKPGMPLPPLLRDDAVVARKALRRDTPVRIEAPAVDVDTADHLDPGLWARRSSAPPSASVRTRMSSLREIKVAPDAASARGRSSAGINLTRI